MNFNKGTLGKGTLGKDRGKSMSKGIPLLALLSFSTPLVLSMTETSGAATTNTTVASHCDVHPFTVTLLQALSASSVPPLESCTFIRNAARAGKVSGVLFHTDLTAGGFEVVPPSYREAQNLKLKDSERLAFEEERDSFQSLKAAWIEDLISLSAAPTAAQARAIWLVKYQPKLSEGSQKTVQKIAKTWVSSAQMGTRL